MDNIDVNKLLNYLSNKGLNQKGIAKTLGVTEQCVNALMTGRRAFGRRSAAEWEKHFGINAAWLMTGQGEMLAEDNADVKQRTLEFIRSKGLSTKRFEEMCGLSCGYVAAMRKGYGQEKLNNVLKAFPDLNRDWLLYGEGEMLKGAGKTASRQVALTNDSIDYITAGGEAFSAMVVKMMNERQIAPYGMLEDKDHLLADKDKEIAALNRQIGKLEAQLESAKKGTVHLEDSATSADVG